MSLKITGQLLKILVSYKFKCFFLNSLALSVNLAHTILFVSFQMLILTKLASRI